MFQMDKQKFGAFVAELRKEKGYTQKDVAAKLFISDKAVSKWETGASIPDVALLVPLAELLGVTVTELLRCERIETEHPMDTMQVEDIVKTAIAYSDEEQAQAKAGKGKKIAVFMAFFLIACFEIAFLLMWGYAAELMTTVLTVEILCAVFGFYFTVLVKEKLPAYYDENKITAYSDGFFRMNLVGIRISNSNWPHIAAVGKVWSLAMMVGYPMAFFVLREIITPVYGITEGAVMLVLMLGGLFVPMYITAKKYE